ncbi:EH signature domain-containing protein [Isoptericola sp. 4D.3]|uniref:EH signature domain-containing protein n=1 Tax=Isoptericola peretonis TaxID=2918523 RepID=A0ABT0IYJ9_9MICO|nr:EH signature domain-containing protein [Isoptericola sp. 4D.3]
MSLVLPAPELTPAPWPADLAETWRAAAEDAAQVSRRAGTGTRFEAVLGEARALLEARRTDEIVGRASDRLFARAVVVLWSEEPRLAQRSMTPALVDAATAGSPSRQTVITLVSLLLSHYDLLDDWHDGLFAAVASAVDRVVASTRRRGHQDLVEVARSSGRYLTRADGPQLFARELVATGTTPENHPEARALCGNDQGRYARVLRNCYYLAQVAAADHTTDGHAFLGDATARATTLRRDEDDRRFGIAVLTALLDKPDDRMPSASWVEAVVEVGGDPRHEQNPAWREWWTYIPDDLRARAVRWMSGADLRAFLGAVRLYAEQNGKRDMQRMFQRRERFLVGLYESGLVRDTRLILGADVRRTVRRMTTLGRIDAPLFKDQASDTAIVFVDCGDFHLVEGSHNFKLHVYMGPPSPDLTDPRARVFTRDTLTKVIPSRHIERHPDGELSFGAWTHDVGGNWLRGSLDFLRDRGVRLDESALVSDADLATLVRRRTGLTPRPEPRARRTWWGR